LKEREKLQEIDSLPTVRKSVLKDISLKLKLFHLTVYWQGIDFLWNISRSQEPRLRPLIGSPAYALIRSVPREILSFTKREDQRRPRESERLKKRSSGY
jgi:hypothetical protein